MHLQVRHESVPVRHRSPPCPRVQTGTGQAVCGRQERRRRFSIRPERFPIQEHLRIELSGPPARQHRLERRLVDTEEGGYDPEIGSERDDGADIQIAIGPAIQPAADSGGERVIDRGVAQRARDTHRVQVAAGVEESLHSNDGIEFQQGHGRGGIVEIDLTTLQSLEDGRRQRVDIDLQADRQRSLR